MSASLVGSEMCIRDRFDCGSYAGGDSNTVCTPRRSGTARRRSTNAGSLSVLSKIRRRCPSLRMLATAWPTVSSRKRPLRSTGRAKDRSRIATVDDQYHH
eukprot:11645603-Alexandrium_andersonii.AAC.1